MVDSTRRKDAQNGHVGEETRLLEEVQEPYHDQGTPNRKTSLNVRQICLCVALALLLFLQGVNISGLTTIQGAVATDLNALSQASWLISSYVIAGSSTQPLFGRLCKIFSPRLCLFASTIIFSIGSIVTAAAPSFVIFCTGRALSGIGGGGIVSCIIMIVLDLVSEKKRGLALGLVNSGFTVGVSLGAIVYGALIKITGWRELFLAQTPFSLLSGIAILFIIPKNVGTVISDESTFSLLKKVDYLGVVTLSSAIVLFLAALASPRVLITPLILSIPFIAAFILVEYRFAADPIIPLTILKSRAALLSSLATSVLMISRWSVLFYGPVYALAIREWPPSLAGTMLIPANLGFAVGGIFVGWFHIRKAQSYYTSSILGTALFVVTLFILSQVIRPNIHVAVFMSATFANGIFTGALLNYTMVHALHLTIASNAFILTSLLATFRGFGASFGSAIGSGIFGRGLISSYTALRESNNLPFDEDLLEQLLGSPGIVETLTGIDHDIAVESYVKGLSRLFMAMGIIGIAGLFLQAGTGWTAPESESERESDDIVRVLSAP